MSHDDEADDAVFYTTELQDHRDLASDGGCFHVIPVDDIEEHVDAVNCWCQPQLDYRDLSSGGEVWLHRSAVDNPQ